MDKIQDSKAPIRDAQWNWEYVNKLANFVIDDAIFIADFAVQAKNKGTELSKEQISLINLQTEKLNTIEEMITNSYNKYAAALISETVVIEEVTQVNKAKVCSQAEICGDLVVRVKKAKDKVAEAIGLYPASFE